MEGIPQKWLLLVVIAVVYLQPWLKNKLEYVQYAKAVI
jgi:hypothetical protein